MDSNSSTTDKPERPPSSGGDYSTQKSLKEKVKYVKDIKMVLYRCQLTNRSGLHSASARCSTVGDTINYVALALISPGGSIYPPPIGKTREPKESKD